MLFFARQRRTDGTGGGSNATRPAGAVPGGPTGEPPGGPGGGLTVGRVLAALAVAGVASLIVWVTVPLNNFLLHNTYIADDYLPPAVMFFVFLLILIVNPLLSLARRSWALNRRQMALILALLSMASLPSSSGFLRMIPYSVAKVTRAASEDRSIAKAYQAANLPPSLFPDPVGYGSPVPASRNFLLKLSEGESIPWGNWVGPLFSWGGFTMAWWVMMIGLAGIVYPQWRRNERLPFPLLTVQQALLESPEPGRRWPRVLCGWSFWAAAGLVFTLHLLDGLHQYWPDYVPEIPLSFNLSSVFAEQPFSGLPYWSKAGRIYFVFLAMAFFMPNRVAFSIWFFQVAYAIYTMLGAAYAPPFQSGIPAEHRNGAWVAMAVAIVWLGRVHWRRVLALALTRRPALDGEERHDRTMGRFFLAGTTALFAWFWWAGAAPGWALYLVVLTFIAGLLLARIVAETGLPMTGFYGYPFTSFMRVLPTAWAGPATAWLAAMCESIIGAGDRVCAAVMAAHGLGLDERASPRHRTRLVWGFVAVLVLALVVCGAVHVRMNYHYSKSLDGAEQPLGSVWGLNQLDAGATLVQEQQAGHWNRPVYNRVGHTIFGMALATGLEWACLAMPAFPFHPIGLLLCYTWFAEQVYINVFIGWALKNLLLFFGGARLYTRARQFFLGLILGDVLAAVFWAVVPGILVLFDMPYKVVQVLPY